MILMFFTIIILKLELGDDELELGDDVQYDFAEIIFLNIFFLLFQNIYAMQYPAYLDNYVNHHIWITVYWMMIRTGIIGYLRTVNFSKISKSSLRHSSDENPQYPPRQIINDS